MCVGGEQIMLSSPVNKNRLSSSLIVEGAGFPLLKNCVLVP